MTLEMYRKVDLSVFISRMILSLKTLYLAHPEYKLEILFILYPMLNLFSRDHLRLHDTFSYIIIGLFNYS